MKKFFMPYIMSALLICLTAHSAYALSVSADSMGFDGTYYSWNINIHDILLSASNPVSGYDLDLSYTADFAKIIFSGALGELAPVELNSTYLINDGTYSLSTLNLGTANLIDFKEQTYYGLGDAAALYSHQSSFLTGNMLTLATVYFTSDQTVQLTNWYAGNGASPFNNEIKLLDNEPLYPPVPEPGTLLLLGSGLAGLATFRRKLGLGIKSAMKLN